MHSFRDQNRLDFWGAIWLFAYAIIVAYVFLALDSSPAFVCDLMRLDLRYFYAYNFLLHPHLLDIQIDK
jgi:hypothetical protein